MNWGARRAEQFPHLGNYTLTPGGPGQRIVCWRYSKQAINGPTPQTRFAVPQAADHSPDNYEAEDSHYIHLHLSTAITCPRELSRTISRPDKLSDNLSMTIKHDNQRRIIAAVLGFRGQLTIVNIGLSVVSAGAAGACMCPSLTERLVPMNNKKLIRR